MKYYTASASQMNRIAEIDRTETITDEYECVLAADGYGIEIREKTFNPPRIFPDWDTQGVERRSTWWKREVDEGGALFFAEENNQIKGFAVLGPMRANQSAEMVALFIDLQSRGKGIGKKLVDMLEAEAIQRGVKAMFVQSNSTVSSVKFYQSVGYTITSLMAPDIIHLPIFETDIILAKKLT